MGLLELATSLATIVSGLVSLTLLFSVALDAVTRGWVRKHARSWLGIEQLRGDHRDTQTFLLALGTSHNELTEAVADENDLTPRERPSMVNVDLYKRRMEDDNTVRRDDFTRGGE